MGNGSLEPEEVQKILEQKERSAAGPTAPACGLMMVGIEFIDSEILRDYNMNTK